MKKQSKADKAFIEKAKSITIGAGAKPEPDKCGVCGGPAQTFVAVPAVAVFSKGYRPARKLKRDDSGEQSLAE